MDLSKEAEVVSVTAVVPPKLPLLTVLMDRELPAPPLLMGMMPHHPSNNLAAKIGRKVAFCV